MSNTINSGLLSKAIQDAVLATLKAEPIAIKDVCKMDASTEATKAGKVTVPFIDTSNVTSATFSGSYADEDLVISPKDITMKEEYISLSLNGFELQSYDLPKMEAIVADATRILAQKVESDVYAVVTAGNYTNKVVCTAANVAGSTLTELRTDLVSAGVPQPLAVVLNPDANAALIEDVGDASKFGSADPAQNGFVGNCRGLKVYEAANLTDTGFALGKDAILVASRGVFSEPGIYMDLVTFQDPKTGIVFTIKSYASGAANAIKHVLSVRYGVAVGNADALVRLADA